MKRIILTGLMMGLLSTAFAQRYMTRTGKITFFSGTPLENIEAFNNEVSAAIDSKKGDVQFIVPIKSFKFEKQLMQEHFNENYLESDTYPKANFTGKIDNLNAVNFAADGSYPAKVSGKMTIHGVTQTVNVSGTITVKGGSVTLHAKFTLKPADYKIRIPAVVESKIAKQIEVTVDTALKPI